MKVIITGGSRGIGRATVELFTKNGHQVVFFYKSNDTLADELCRLTGATAIKCDVKSSEDAATAVNQAVEILGGIDSLVNNAGISEFCFFDSINDEQWKNMIDTNLSGAFYVTREAVKHMIPQKKGAIVNVGSMWGKVGAS